MKLIVAQLRKKYPAKFITVFRILAQINHVHTLVHYFLIIHYNTFLPSTPSSTMLSFVVVLSVLTPITVAARSKA
jgi:hypothetical protein